MASISDQNRARLLLEPHRNGYTLRFFLRSMGNRYLLLLGACGLILFAWWYFPAEHLVPELACFFVGFSAGAMMRDIGWFRGIKAAWRFSEKVTDWDKVQKIADGHAV